MQMLPKPIEQNDKQISLSNIYQVRQGNFGINNGSYINIYTYFCSSQVQHLKQDIKTSEKLTEDKYWPVSQIIQLEIDYNRVQQMAKQYLMSESKIKYYPPIIVAILPKKDYNEESEIAENFTPYDSSQENTDKDLVFKKSEFSSEATQYDHWSSRSKNLSKAQGLYIIQEDAFKHTLFAWDKNKHYAIVIDGQHRLESLKIASDEQSKMDNMQQDVIFIDFSEKCLNEKIAPVEAVRTIFIDINYRAIPVTPARRCLMDDRDLASLFLQELVNDAEKVTRKGKFIRPEIIDWHSDALKFELPHITGVMTLYQLMSDIMLEGCDLSDLRQLKNPRKIGIWIEKLNRNYAIDVRIENEIQFNDCEKLSKSKEKYNEALKRQSSGLEDEDDQVDVLFNYDHRILKLATDTFTKCYVESLVYFFENIYPYAKAIEFMEGYGVFDQAGKHSLNKAMIKSKHKRSSNEKDAFDKLNEAIRSEMKNMGIFFTVLGQKALFSSYKKVLTAIKHTSSQIPSKDKIQNETEKFIKRWNLMFEVSQCSSIYRIFEGKESTQHDSIIRELANDKKIPELLNSQKTIKDYGVISQSFWEDIIFWQDKIIYTQSGVDAFQAVLEQAVNYVSKRIEAPSQTFELSFDSPKTSFSKISNTIIRHLKQSYSDLADSQGDLEMRRSTILENKRIFLKYFLDDCINNYLKKHKVES